MPYPDIMEAIRINKLFIVKKYHVNNALDSVPKNLIATRYRDKVQQYAPRLAQLINQVLKVPVTTQLEPYPLKLRSGVPGCKTESIST